RRSIAGQRRPASGASRPAVLECYSQPARVPGRCVAPVDGGGAGWKDGSSQSGPSWASPWRGEATSGNSKVSRVSLSMEIKQQLRLTQQLVMTPQLQQAIKLLQLSRLEL